MGLIYGCIFRLQVDKSIIARRAYKGWGRLVSGSLRHGRPFFCYKFKIFSASILLFQPAAELTLQPPPVRHHQAVVS